MQVLTEVCGRAYATFPYPCIRGFHFVWLMMIKNKIYPKVVEAGKKGDTVFLDIGCMSAFQPITHDIVWY